MIRFDKIMTSTLALALLGCGGSSGSSTPTPSPTPSAVVPGNPVTPAPTPSATPAPSSLNVLFIGGSITRGSAATTLDKSYPRLVASWLAQRIASVAVSNIAVGSSTSEFAAYRFEHDIGAFKPDVAIIEFAVNDLAGKKAISTAAVDALIYKLRQVNPQVRIIYAAVTLPGDEQNRRAGTRDERSLWAEEVVKANGGTFVDAGAGLWREVIAGTRTASQYFADDLHPNDLGHETYAAAIEGALGDAVSGKAVTPNSSSLYISRTRLDSSRLAERDEIVTATTCSKTSLTRLDAWQQSRSYYDQAMVCQAGDNFTAQFSGTTFGLVNLNTPGGGPLECLIDGTTPAVMKQLAENQWTLPQIFIRDLADGPHRLSCTAKGPFTIGTFLVSRAQPL